MRKQQRASLTTSCSAAGAIGLNSEAAVLVWRRRATQERSGSAQVGSEEASAAPNGAAIPPVTTIAHAGACAGAWDVVASHDDDAAAAAAAESSTSLRSGSRKMRPLRGAAGPGPRRSPSESVASNGLAVDSSSVIRCETVQITRRATKVPPLAPPAEAPRATSSLACCRHARSSSARHVLSVTSPYPCTAAAASAAHEPIRPVSSSVRNTFWAPGFFHCSARRHQARGVCSTLALSMDASRRAASCAGRRVRASDNGSAASCLSIAFMRTSSSSTSTPIASTACRPSLLLAPRPPSSPSHSMPIASTFMAVSDPLCKRYAKL